MADDRGSGERRRLGNGWIWIVVVIAAVLAWWIFNLGTASATT